jgi:hypothetical protein
MEVYKWVITGGVAADPVLIELDATTAGTYLTGLANPGFAPQVFPLDDNLFYLDGNATYPTLMDKDGNIIDGFYAKPSALKDSVTAPPAKWSMNQGHNGVKEFQIGDNYFLIMAASNTAGVPPSTFRIFKFADASKAFSGLQCLWTFPQAGMGAASNTYRTAVPTVEVSGNTANIYLYTGENGYGMYQMTVGSTGISDTKVSKVTLSLVENQIKLSEQVSSVQVYSVTGQKVAAVLNVSTLPAPTVKGIYVVTAIDKTGAKLIQKIAVN